MKVKPVLDSYQLQDGTFALKIRLTKTVNKKTTQEYFPMDVYLKTTEWDSKACRVKLDKKANAVEINMRLTDIMNAAEKAILKKQPGIERLIGTMVDPQYKSQHTPDSYFTLYVKWCKEGKILHEKTQQPLAENYIKTFTTTQTRLNAFAKAKRGGQLTFHDIDETFYNEFVNYLRHEYVVNKVKGMRENSIGTSIKRLITVFKKAKKDGHLNRDDFDDFIIITQDVDNVALTEDEIQKMISKDLSEHPHLVLQRERFLIAYNFLLRFNDSMSVDEKHVHEDQGRYFMRMTTGKTKEPVYIPIMPMVYDILKKHNFRMPKISNQKGNDNLKQLCKVCEIDSDYLITEYIKGKKVERVYKKWLLVTHHTSRRTAATILYLTGMDLESIRMFGGWRTIKQVMDYIKIEKLENARRQMNHEFFNLQVKKTVDTGKSVQ